MHYLVTGASGFVGRTLCQRLVERGEEVTALSRSFNDIAGVCNIQIDNFLDKLKLARYMQGVDVVVHLAARAHVFKEKATNPIEEFHRANVEVTEAIATCAKSAKVKRVVYLSTIGVNGNFTNGHPFTELDVPNPTDNYARSKLESERTLRDVLADGHTSYVVLRPPLVYGPRCPGNFLKLLKLIKTLPILPFGACQKLHSFIYLENLVDAIIVASSSQAVGGQTLLISDGEDISLAQLTRQLAVAMGKPAHVVKNFPPTWLKMLAGFFGKSHVIEKMTGELRVDSSQFSQLTNWIPPHSVCSGLSMTANWFIHTY